MAWCIRMMHFHVKTNYLATMNKENVVKLVMLIGFLILFLSGSRFRSEEKKVMCSEGKCDKPHQHGELNYHERFPITPSDNWATATIKSCANFWEANATGMTFALIIGGAALSLALSYKKFNKILQLKGMKGAALGSVFGMPLNMCANCSAVTSVGMTSQSGSTEATLGVILGGALLNFIGIVTLFGLFNPAIVISRVAFSLIMILLVVPFVSRYAIQKKVATEKANPIFDLISCYVPEKNFQQTVFKSLEDWLIATGNIAWRLIPLMLLGTFFTALFRVFFSNDFLESISGYNQFAIIAIVSFVGTFLSIPVLFEILIGTILLQLGFSIGAIAAVVFTAPSFGLFTLVLTRKKLGGLKIPLALMATTFIFGIGAGYLAEFLTNFFDR